MSARRVGALIVGVGLLLALLCGAGSSCGSGNTPADDKYSRDCEAKGGVPRITHRGNSTTRMCDRAPLPTPGPNGRWQ